jgi:23S rRNA (uridine2552-2'-O)-methyltransferase
MGRKKQRMDRKDGYYRLAKKMGYRSRAIYKLMDINKNFQVIKLRDRVLDLGAAPGGWLQYISDVVGIDGYVLGVDIRPIEPLDKMNVDTIMKDIYDEDIVDAILEKFDKKFDVITSDISANISGIWDVDVIRSFELNKRVLEIADRLLRRGGNLILKAFEGKEMSRLVKLVKNRFRAYRLYKPKASRKRSSEIYMICLGYSPRRTSRNSL